LGVGFEAKAVPRDGPPVATDAVRQRESADLRVEECDLVSVDHEVAVREPLNDSIVTVRDDDDEPSVRVPSRRASRCLEALSERSPAGAAERCVDVAMVAGWLVASEAELPPHAASTRHTAAAAASDACAAMER
jgi:hypothetical protein